MDFQSLYELYQNYRKLPHGSERAERIHDAITQADLQQNHFWRFHLRYDLMLEQAFHGDEGKILPIITELTAIYEEHSIADAESDYVYALYLCINQWDCLPQLSLGQLNDMMERYQKAVYQYRLGDKSYYERCCEIAIRQEKWELAEQAYQKMLHAKFPDTSDCAACTCYSQVDYFLQTQQKEKAWQTAQPVLNGMVTCEQEPERILSSFLQFALDYETHEQATYWADLLRPQLAKNEYNPDMLRWLAYHDTDKALRMLESGVAEVWGEWDQKGVFELCTAAWVVCLQYNKQSPEQVVLTLPKIFPLWQENSLYAMDTLGTFFYTHAQKIARAFDTRNNSHYYQNKLNHANHLGSSTTESLAKIW